MTRLRLAFHAFSAELAALRAPGWQVRRGAPGELTTPAVPTLVRVASGVGPAAARRCAAALPPLAIEGALLGGFAGGLAPDLAPGTVVIADPLLDASGSEPHPVAVPLADELERAARRAGLPLRRGPLVTVSRVVEDPATKAALYRRHGALAVDMESAALAAALAARGVPAGAARVVLDTAEDRLPATGGSPRRLLAALREPAVRRGLLSALRAMRPCARAGARLIAAWLEAAGTADASRPRTDV